MINLQNLTNPIKQAIDALEEIIDLVRDVTHGEYIPDYFTTQPCEIALKALREYQDDWISVDNIDFDCDTFVLGWSATKGHIKVMYDTTRKEFGRMDSIGYWHTENITHWQSLPEPPMNKGDE